MAGSPGGGAQPSPEGSNDLLWVMALIVAIVLALWFFARGTLLTVILSIKLAELQVLGLFTDSFLPTEMQIRASMGNLYEVSFTQFSSWLTIVGTPFRIPVAIGLIVLAGLLYFTHPLLKFLNQFDMQRLLDTEKDNWPQVAPVAELDLLKEDINDGPWAMAMAPMVFAKKHELIEELPLKPVTSFLQPSHIEVTVIKKKAEEVFSKQLGPLWRGVSHLPRHAQALFAVFAARANQDKELALQLLTQLSQSYVTKKLDYSGLDAALKKHGNTALVQEVISRHAYQYTVMAAMLELARSDGVLASSDFLWLKPTDRPLWFMLNNTGRQVAFTETAGVFAHFRAEKMLKRKLTQPMVQEAVTALDLALKDIIYTRDPVTQKEEAPHG